MGGVSKTEPLNSHLVIHSADTGKAATYKTHTEAAVRHEGIPEEQNSCHAQPHKVFIVNVSLEQWLPTFLALQPFNTAPHIVVTPGH